MGTRHLYWILTSPTFAVWKTKIRIQTFFRRYHFSIVNNILLGLFSPTFKGLGHQMNPYYVLVHAPMIFKFLGLLVEEKVKMLKIFFCLLL